jgi:hypothetical protein
VTHPACDFPASTNPFLTGKVRLVGFGFNKANPVVLWITPTGCRVIEEKHPFSVLMHLNYVSQTMKTPTKNHDFCIIFYSLFGRFSKNGSF